MGFQEDYDQYPAAAVAGMKVDSREDTVETFAAEGAVPFGRAVIAGTDDEVQAKLPAAAGGKFRGVALRTSIFQQSAAGVSQYVAEDAMNVLRAGQVWVELISDVANDAAAYFDNGSTAAGANAGKFTDVNDGSSDDARGVFRSAGTSGGLAKLELHLQATADVA